MADINSDDDPDSAAMAEAMGFTGFGMQRATRKRKLTPPAQTGANNAPLGKRRPMNLPQPVSSVGANAEEIDLDADDGGGGDDDVVEEEQEGDNDDAQAQAGIDALTVSDTQPGHQHQLPPRPPPPQQQQQQHHHAGKAGRSHGGPNAGGRAGAGAPWWEGEWDPRLVERMVENPWERLERQRGLEPRGTWPSKGAGAPAGTMGGGGAAVGSFGGGEVAAALATVVS
ncbi:hypothetical protein Daus18300_000323 [Diaporthe australafricana]|uniref:Uncharacterized protein n=1 Tax=Diaporthe australafricana TaxID=127596 RepID=A0ABR3Y5Q1_9PEZI